MCRAHLLTISAAVASLLASARAESLLPTDRIALDALADFRPVTANWKLASALAGDPRREKSLTPVGGTGLLVCTLGTHKETRGHLVTAWEHADLKLDLEVLPDA